MKVVGLVTEYNPFHNGHKYHIEQAKKLTGADYAIAVMSGNFVQRGTPALLDKYTRAEMALRNGVDLVLELPVCYATGSAEYFAHGAISLLDKLGIVDYLCFGSECGDLELLRAAAKALLDTPDGFDEKLLSSLKDGLTYPAARLKALEQTQNTQSGVDDIHLLSTALKEPNNILGIEYLKAMENLSSAMVPVTIQRKQAHYHEERLSDAALSESTYWNGKSEPGHTRMLSGRLHPDPEQILSGGLYSDPEQISFGSPVISSATAIRNALLDSYASSGVNNISSIESSVPKDVYRLLCSCYHKTCPITEEDFSQILKYKLMTEDTGSLSGYVDITSDLADRMKNMSAYDGSIAELCGKIKTRNMTLTRINRAMLHMLLNIREDDFREFNRNGYSSYARVLSIKKESSRLLRQITEHGSIPVITKVADASRQLDALSYKMLSKDIYAAHVYNLAVYEKYREAIPTEYRHGIVML